MASQPVLHGGSEKSDGLRASFWCCMVTFYVCETLGESEPNVLCVLRSVRGGWAAVEVIEFEQFDAVRPCVVEHKTSVVDHDYIVHPNGLHSVAATCTTLKWLCCGGYHERQSSGRHCTKRCLRSGLHDGTEKS